MQPPNTRLCFVLPHCGYRFPTGYLIFFVLFLGFLLRKISVKRRENDDATKRWI